MPARGEQKGEAGLGQGANHLGLGSLQVDAGGLEHIGRAHPAAGAAVAVFGHMGAAGGRHKGHGRGDVETVRPVAAGAAGVDQGQGRAGRREVTGLPQHLGHGC